MQKIIDFFIQQSLMVNVLAVLIVLAGLFALTSMHRDLHPPFQSPMVIASASLPGATSGEIEKYITFPIEEALRGLPGVEEITSQSSSGVSQITLHYSPSMGDRDQLESTELVRNRIDSIRYRLPTEIRWIQVKRARQEGAFLFWLGIEGIDENNQSHRDFFKSFEDDLNQVKGIQRVFSSARERDVYIELIPQKLKANEISANEVRRAIQQATRLAPIGEMRVNEEPYTIEISKTSDTLQEIAQIPLRGNRMGHHLTIQDIAQVGYKLSEKKEIVRVNSRPGLSFWIRKDFSADIIDLKKRTMAIIEKHNAKAPPGIRIVTLIDGPQFLEQQLGILTSNATLGFCIVFFVLMVFLSWKTALMTSLGLPIAYLGTLTLLYFMGFQLDLLSMIGMIMIIGVLVDDSIIVSERYIYNLSKGLPPKEAAGSSVRDLMLPVTGTVLTSVVAFSPMIFSKSPLGQIMLAVPVVVILALLLSWMESFFILPNHLAHFVKAKHKEKVKPKRDFFSVDIFSKFQSVYKSLIQGTLRFRYLTLLGILGLFSGVAYLALHKIQMNYSFNLQPKYIKVNMILKKSSSLEATYSVIKPVEDFLNSFPTNKVEEVQSRVGTIWFHGKRHEGHRYAQVHGFLSKQHKYPTQLQREIQPQVEKFLEQYDRSEFQRLDVQVARHGGDERKEGIITVRVRGSEKIDFRDIESEVIEVATATKEIKAHSPEPRRYQKSWEFVPRPKSLVQYNLTAYDVGRQIRGAFTPDEVAEIRLEGEKVYIYMEMLNPFRHQRSHQGGQDNKMQKMQNHKMKNHTKPSRLLASKETAPSPAPIKPQFKELGNYEVVTSSGVSVPLKFLGQWKEKKTLRQISHLNGLRDLKIDFQIDRDQATLTSANMALKKAIDPLAQKFPSYDIQVVEPHREDTQNKNWAIKVATLCLLGVFAIMALILGSITQPFIVGFPILFGGAGIILALYLHNMELGSMSLIGFIAVVGVSVNASIVMVDHMYKISSSHRGGRLSKETIIQGASDRLRAIILTTITTLGGILPMAYSWGGESGFTQPLALSMGWGIGFATLMTLLTLPSLLQIREDVISLFGIISQPSSLWPPKPPQESESFDSSS